MSSFSGRADFGRRALRIAFGVVAIVAGADKFANLLTDWTQYVSPFAANVIPISPEALMRLAGIIEMFVGAMLLTRWVLVASYILAAWLTMIAANLILSGQYFDVAVRDLLLALAAFTMGELTRSSQAGEGAQGPGERLSPTQGGN